MHSFNLMILLADASLFAQVILFVLAMMLYLSLWYILRKRYALRRYERACASFEKDFIAVSDLQVLEKLYRTGTQSRQGLVGLFLLGQDELRKSKNGSSVDRRLTVDGIRRSLEVAIESENTYLDRHMQFLATVASVSPYIGLLGTVWGIISAFQSLAQTSQATIAQVAPGIAEALVATAMGLLAAIPALVAYNYFNKRLQNLTVRLENFSNRYVNAVSRHL